jgi:pSer/pThr/pTyr-binding forkhead associated (FHA) protein
MSSTGSGTSTHVRSQSQGTITSRLTRTFSGQRRQRRNQEMPSISTAATSMTSEPSPTSAPPVSSPFSALSEVKPPHVRIVPSLEAPGQSLIFSVIEMDLENGNLVKIGRFTDRRNLPNRVTFRSKVVSRAHAEMWSEGRKVKLFSVVPRGEVPSLPPLGLKLTVSIGICQIFLRDTKSSSGTFLNNIRLSPPGSESKPVELKDGDIVQLGVDYQGGAEEIYRSVKMKFEINRTWQQKANPFSLNALNNLRSLGGTPNTITRTSSNASPAIPQGSDNSLPATNSSASPILPAQVEIEECCICLFAIAPFQALFLAPCSHTYHYKCIRPLLVQNHPAFSCPICRTYADLEANVAVEAEEVLEMYGFGQNSDHPATASITNIRPPSLRAMASTTSLNHYPVRQNSIAGNEGHIPYPIESDSAHPEAQALGGLPISQTIPPIGRSGVATREAMAHTLVENSQYGMAERMRLNSVSSEGMNLASTCSDPRL